MRPPGKGRRPPRARGPARPLPQPFPRPAGPGPRAPGLRALASRRHSTGSRSPPGPRLAAAATSTTSPSRSCWWGTQAWERPASSCVSRMGLSWRGPLSPLWASTSGLPTWEPPARGWHWAPCWSWLVVFQNKVLDVDGMKVKLQIWDTAGQERFRSVTHAYYRDAHALLLLYDVTNKASFDNIQAWLTEIQEYAQHNVVLMLLGNKVDSAQERVVKREDGEKLAKEYGLPFMETSAKTGLNVDLAFTAIAKELKQRSMKAPSEPRFQLHDYVKREGRGASCCRP
ncbi:ras-related protein Rab-26 isoform 16-T16 [Hipposideros larvatus]